MNAPVRAYYGEKSKVDGVHTRKEISISEVKSVQAIVSPYSSLPRTLGPRSEEARDALVDHAACAVATVRF